MTRHATSPSLALNSFEYFLPNERRTKEAHPQVDRKTFHRKGVSTWDVWRSTHALSLIAQAHSLAGHERRDLPEANHDAASKTNSLPQRCVVMSRGRSLSEACVVMSQMPRAN